MGGKSGGPLSAWIKEFTTLVFVQTVQAFVYAIIITVIMNAMKQGSLTKEDYISGVGLMAILALTSLFKIEELIRRIFGLGNTKADHRGAIKSIAKTAFAFQLGKKVLDNGAKMARGAKTLGGGMINYGKQKRRIGKKYGDLKGKIGTPKNQSPKKTPLLGQKISTLTGGVVAQKPNSTLTGITPRPNKPAVKGNNDYYKKALEAKKAGNMDKYHEYMGMQAGINKREKMAKEGKQPKIGDDTKYMKAAMQAKKDGNMDKYHQLRGMQAGFNKQGKSIADRAHEKAQQDVKDALGTANVGNSKPITATIPNQPQSVDLSTGTPQPANVSYSGANLNNGVDPKIQQKIQQMKDDIEKNKADRNKAIKSGLTDLLKGSAETAGAVIGATTGAILGGADGNLEEAIQGLMSGAGVGDTVGGKAASGISGVAGFTVDRAADAKKIADDLKSYRQSITSGSNAKGLDRVNEQIQAEGQAIEQAVSDRRKQTKNYREAVKNIDKLLKDSSSSEPNAYSNSVDDA